jgi:hypothetical protein
MERDSEVITGKSSDDRLREDEVEGINRTMHETVLNVSDVPAASEHEPTSSSSRLNVNMSMISNNFNFLDKVFKKSTRGPMGRGSENDGVFSNMSAKPDAQPQVDSDKPPTYEEAAADSTPPYWENSILTPGFEDEVFVDGLPVGNIVNFIWNLMVSASFQFVGFLLTYILHTSHAAKQGSRAGLGLTFIMYAYSMFPSQAKFHLSEDNLASERVEVESPTDYDVSGSNEITGSLDRFHSSLNTGTDMSLELSSSTKSVVAASFVVLLGLFIFFKAFHDYHRARKMEQVILAPPTNLPEQPQPEEMV